MKPKPCPKRPFSGTLAFQSRAHNSTVDDEDIAFDVRVFHDPQVLRETRVHDGRYELILRGISSHQPEFDDLLEKVHSAIGVFRPALQERDVIVGMVCRAGKHRSSKQIASRTSFHIPEPPSRDGQKWRTWPKHGPNMVKLAKPWSNQSTTMVNGGQTCSKNGHDTAKHGQKVLNLANVWSDNGQASANIRAKTWPAHSQSKNGRPTPLHPTEGPWLAPSCSRTRLGMPDFRRLRGTSSSP